ncbi:MAG: winged helix-turn-helix domain-containing protein [Candidatus Latescibacteria bacterium]|nr:winged helix-turn-helix domain-containing protein [Candidatus Latescibacterota bacterium]
MNASRVKISASTARRLAVRSQGLDGGWKLSKGKEGAAQVLERLGYVQIDTIAVVERAHHHVFWTRHAGYDARMLHDLLARDRRAFETWTHAAAYVPMQDYRFFLPEMRAHADRPRTRQWLKQNARLAKDVLDRIRQEGPLGSADFEDPRKRGPWWDWKPAKRALEVLLSTGELMVAERRNFNRLYDLTERVLPSSVDTTTPTPEEVARFVVRRLLGSLGIASVGDLRWEISDRKGVSGAIREMVDAGEVTPAEVEGVEGEGFYALTEALEASSRRGQRLTPVHLLSPFDNLVIWRRRLKKLFGFDYTIECYVPAPKRRYGYFCLPVLWGDRFVGRLDPKADRKGKTFIVRCLAFEPGFEDEDGLLPALAEKLRTFAAFQGCERVVVERTAPGKMKAALKRSLKDAGVGG